MKPISVMVAGLRGKMATLVAEAVASQSDMRLFPYALSEEALDIPIANGDTNVRLVSIDEHTLVLARLGKEIDLIVDFTQPKSVNRNADLYCSAGIPFVMGTTGGDRIALCELVESSEISAVIATNMATPVVMFQEMIRFAAKSFPGALSGFKLVIRESHQASKPDPSGTVVSVLDAFEELGVPFKKEQIIMVRDPIVQEVEMGIPQQYLGGHGYHTYTLMSPDGTVMLQFTHNVLGRSVYVDGALRAIRFLAKHKIVTGRVFSMADVLKG